MPESEYIASGFGVHLIHKCSQKNIIFDDVI